MRACSTRNHAGFSIVELLVAVALSGILLGGVVAIFISWRSSAAISERLSFTETTGHHALDELASAIRSAGFPGCARSPHHISSSIDTRANTRWNTYDAAIHGYRSDEVELTLDEAPGIVPGTDAVRLRGVRNHADALKLRAPMLVAEDLLPVTASRLSQLRIGDVAMVYTCDARAIFVVTHISDDLIAHERGRARDTGPSNSTDSLGYAFDIGAEVLPLTISLYYVGIASNQRGHSLWRRVGDAVPEEIVPGVENMRLLYGSDLDADGSIDEYVSARGVADWSVVHSVDIELQVRVPADNDISDMSARPNGMRTFRTVVTLRNPGNVY